ncbi:54S ribosomal protein L39, mitochondrial [Geranomyces michiganensis]|nr:54S ribosomal protein L39, mitochondrial [Geranomyces michiganensis]
MTLKIPPLLLRRSRRRVVPWPAPKRTALLSSSQTRLHGTLTQHRLAVWDEHAEKLRTANQQHFAGKSITVGLEGRTVTGQAGVLTPLDVTKGLNLATDDAFLLAVVDKQHAWDLSRPLEADCALELVPTNSTAALAQHTVWHSGAHLLGWAMERQFGDTVHLCDGPALKTGGFFYDSLIRANNHPESLDGTIEQRIARLMRSDDGGLYHVTTEDLQQLAGHMKSFAKKKARFQRLVVPRGVAETMFIHNPFKLHFLSRVPADAPVTLYRCGEFIDLCRGPHVPHTGYLRSHKLTKTAGAQWDETAGAPRAGTSVQPLSRVYGISFSTAEALGQWQTVQEEAARRDHRVVGKQQGLFAMNALAPGSPFMLPHGTRIVQKLLDFLRAEYRRFGYSEVVTPLLFNKEVWVTSGHWEHYKDDMFVVHTGSGDSTLAPAVTTAGLGPNNGDAAATAAGCCGGARDDADHPADADIHGLKPMNCPGHCLVYASSAKSYRDLPVRLAEFSPLHRNEASGALTGLTRVRKFHQDDAHIFCTPEQIQTEISATLQFIHRVYTVFGLPSYELVLSTRPAKHIGTTEQWDHAESQLRAALDHSSIPWTLREGDGAFYGPKIDVLVHDALGRSHQTATCQLDFQLPTRFDLKYQAADGAFHTPVIVHRAILGSVERMLAMLIEHYAGRWPFWLSPRQAVVVPVAQEFTEYASAVAAQLSGRGLDPADVGRAIPAYWHVDVDSSDRSLPKRIRDAQAAQYNYMLVVGETERAAQAVSVRRRDGVDLGVMTVPQIRALFTQHDREFQ